MSLRFKLVLVTLFVALVPLLVSGLTALSIHQTAFEKQLADGQGQTATASSELVRAIVLNAKDKLASAVLALPWSALDLEEQDGLQVTGAMQVVYRQDPDVAVVAILDTTGSSVVPSAFRAPKESGDNISASQETRERFIESVPVEMLSATDPAFGEIFAGDDNQVLIPIIVPVEGPKDSRWAIVVAWSTSSVCTALQTVKQSGLEPRLFDSKGRLLCSTPSLQPAPSGLVDSAAASGELERFDYTSGSDAKVAVKASPLPGWLLVVDQPRATAEKPSRRIRQQTIYWIAAGLAIALFAGLFLAQGISKRVGMLKSGAEALARGDLDQRIDDPARDELGVLATTFNDMAGELERRRKEIEGFNAELQDRVDERTRELKVAQKQLLESQKVAAVSSLAAGFAHEINNPLTGVLGLSQMLTGRFSRQEGQEKTVKSLKAIEAQAQRIREIVKTLESVAEESSGGLARVATRSVVEPLPNLLGELATDKEVAVELEIADDLADISADAPELTQALVHMVRNAITASKAGSKVIVRAENGAEGLVKLMVTDTGVGIAPEHIDRLFEPFFTTKQEWGGKGLGLTVAYRVIQQHRGTVDVQSELGKGTTMTIMLPAHREGALLV